MNKTVPTDKEQYESPIFRDIRPVTIRGENIPAVTEYGGGDGGDDLDLDE